MNSKWSLWSEDSMLSIGSRGSMLSIGSIGSAASVMSIGSAASMASALSAASRNSIMSARGNGVVMGRPSTRRTGAIAIGVTTLATISMLRRKRGPGTARPGISGASSTPS